MPVFPDGVAQKNTLTSSLWLLLNLMSRMHWNSQYSISIPHKNLLTQSKLATLSWKSLLNRSLGLLLVKTLTDSHTVWSALVMLMVHWLSTTQMFSFQDTSKTKLSKHTLQEKSQNSKNSLCLSILLNSTATNQTWSRLVVTKCSLLIFQKTLKTQSSSHQVKPICMKAESSLLYLGTRKCLIF